MAEHLDPDRRLAGPVLGHRLHRFGTIVPCRGGAGSVLVGGDEGICVGAALEYGEHPVVVVSAPGDRPAAPLRGGAHASAHIDSTSSGEHANMRDTIRSRATSTGTAGAASTSTDVATNSKP